MKKVWIVKKKKKLEMGPLNPAGNVSQFFWQTKGFKFNWASSDTCQRGKLGKGKLFS